MRMPLIVAAVCIAVAAFFGGFAVAGHAASHLMTHCKEG